MHYAMVKIDKRVCAIYLLPACAIYTPAALLLRPLLQVRSVSGRLMRASTNYASEGSPRIVVL